jgi:acyl-coenzyme A thioesterase PaaI-like protein
MKIQTHELIDAGLCGRAISVEPGCSRVELTPLQEMAVDARGLVHGGFVFGLADYAAMIAVNDPNVVLGAAESRFLKPVQVGQRLVAEARVDEVRGKKHVVSVRVTLEGESVFTGVFSCFVLDKHVLA